MKFSKTREALSVNADTGEEESNSGSTYDWVTDEYYKHMVDGTATSEDVAAHEQWLSFSNELEKNLTRLNDYGTKLLGFKEEDYAKIAEMRQMLAKKTVPMALVKEAPKKRGLRL